MLFLLSLSISWSSTCLRLANSFLGTIYTQSGMSVIVVHVRSPQHPPTIGFDGESWLMCQPIFHEPIASSSLLLSLKEPSYALSWSAQEICPQGLQSPHEMRLSWNEKSPSHPWTWMTWMMTGLLYPKWLRKPAGYLLWIYILLYIYVYGYVSIDNISYESPLTTNIPHDLGNLLKCPFGTSSKGWAGVGLSAYTAADVCRSRCSDTLRNGLEFFAGNVLVFLTASENMAKTG